MHYKKDDLVVVITGAHRGKQGRVMRVLEAENKIVVQGINLRYKHLRRSQKNPQGGRVRREQAIDASNVLLVDPKTNRPTRVGFRREGDKKIRYAKRSGEPV